jgi:formate hydrogenlyase subunit 3/multisubunit Na+/H+ antiporter MnhD subunit
MARVKSQKAVFDCPVYDHGGAFNACKAEERMSVSAIFSYARQGLLVEANLDNAHMYYPAAHRKLLWHISAMYGVSRMKSRLLQPT